MEDIEIKVTVPIKVSFETEVSVDTQRLADNFRESEIVKAVKQSVNDAFSDVVSDATSDTVKESLWATGGRNLTEMSTLKLYPSDNRTVGVFSPCGRFLGEAFYNYSSGINKGWNIWCPLEERWFNFNPENLYWGELTGDELSKINKDDE